jgi:hypothetical protein
MSEELLEIARGGSVIARGRLRFPSARACTIAQAMAHWRGGQGVAGAWQVATTSVGLDWIAYFCALR